MPAGDDGRREPPARPALVCTVVLTYNNFDDTNECLETLIDQDYPNHRVVLVDNDSRDGSYERLAERWRGRVEIVRASGNLGVAAGYNLGLGAALDAGADFIVVCNNDIAVTTDFVSSLVGAFRSNGRAGLIVPLTTFYDRPELIWFAGVRFHPWFGYSINRLQGRPLAESSSLPPLYETDYVLTHASMLSRETAEAVGRFDDRCFYGHDDIDYSMRARKAGFRCLVLNRPLVRHKVSVTVGRRGSLVLGPKGAYTYGRESVLVGARHFRGLRAVTFLLGLVCLRAPLTITAMARERRWDSIAAYLRGLSAGAVRYGPWFFNRAASEPAVGIPGRAQDRSFQREPVSGTELKE
jgi:GT2 family glycosyltransferase